jgi:hypothetical protein
VAGFSAGKKSGDVTAAGFLHKIGFDSVYMSDELFVVVPQQQLHVAFPFQS